MPQIQLTISLIAGSPRLLIHFNHGPHNIHKRFVLESIHFPLPSLNSLSIIWSFFFFTVMKNISQLEEELGDLEDILRDLDLSSKEPLTNNQADEKIQVWIESEKTTICLLRTVLIGCF